MSQSVLGELLETSNSTDLSKMWAVMMEREINTNLETTRKLLAVLIDLEASLNRRNVIINEGRNDGLVLGSIQNSTPWMIIARKSDTERIILKKYFLGMRPF
ncbi:hypothetical protein Tco_0816640 [Tanacetum coccineum]